MLLPEPLRTIAKFLAEMRIPGSLAQQEANAIENKFLEEEARVIELAQIILKQCEVESLEQKLAIQKIIEDTLRRDRNDKVCDIIDKQIAERKAQVQANAAQTYVFPAVSDTANAPRTLQQEIEAAAEQLVEAVARFHAAANAVDAERWTRADALINRLPFNEYEREAAREALRRAPVAELIRRTGGVRVSAENLVVRDRLAIIMTTPRDEDGKKKRVSPEAFLKQRTKILHELNNADLNEDSVEQFVRPFCCAAIAEYEEAVKAKLNYDATVNPHQNTAENKEEAHAEITEFLEASSLAVATRLETCITTAESLAAIQKILDNAATKAPEPVASTTEDYEWVEVPEYGTEVARRKTTPIHTPKPSFATFSGLFASSRCGLEEAPEPVASRLIPGMKS